MPNTPVAPSISSVTTNSFLIAVNPDGNPGGTFYAFQVSGGPIIQWVNGFGGLQSTIVFLAVSAITVTTATSSTLYNVALAAALDAEGTGVTGYGPAATVDTLPAAPVPALFQNIFSTTVVAQWNPNGNPAGTLFDVQLSQDPGFITGVLDSGFITTIGYQFINLLPSSTYYGRVKARNTSAVDSAWTSLSSVVTPSGPGILANVQVYNLLGERGYWLTWTPARETNVINYNVYRSPSPTDNSSFIRLATTASSNTNYVDRVPFTFGIVYYYKITAVDNGGNESSLVLSPPFQDNTFHSFEEQPFPSVVQDSDFVNGETPSGTLDGVNRVFGTANAFVKGSLQVFVNGIKQTLGINYTENNTQNGFTFDPAWIPSVSSVVRVNYIQL